MTGANTMKIPKRVLDAAVNAYLCTDRGHRMKAVITAALQEWIASGQAQKGSGHRAIYDRTNGAFVATGWVLPEEPHDFPVLIIRMEPDND